MDEVNVGIIAEMGQDGDIKYSWDRSDPRDCEAAHEHFREMRRKGFFIFKIKWLGLRRKKVDCFDSKDEQYVFEAPDLARHEAPYNSPEIAEDFDSQADYVVTPAAMGG